MKKDIPWVLQESYEPSKKKQNRCCYASWDLREDNYLRENIGSYSVKELAKLLNRTPASVRGRIKKLNLSRREESKKYKSKNAVLREAPSEVRVAKSNLRDIQFVCTIVALVYSGFITLVLLIALIAKLIN